MQSQRLMFVPLLILGALLSIICIDDSALWVDELGTWAITQHSPWLVWCEKVWNHFNSDGQLALYHAYMKVWVDAFGDTARIIRLSNAPWVVLTLIALWRIPAKNHLLKFWLVFFFCIHAFVWYYLNEARPYMLLLAGASWFTVGVLRIAQHESRTSETDVGVKEALLGATMLVAGNILGGLWLASTLVALWITYPKALKSAVVAALKNPVFSLINLLTMAVIVGVALHSFFAGARASQAAAFSLPGFVYGLLELTGATGLGPSRHQLRANLGAVSKVDLGLMLCLAALVCWLLLSSWLRLTARQKAALFLAAIAPLIGMIFIGMILHWRVVGRHLSAVLPLVLMGLAISSERIFRAQKGNTIEKWGAAVVILALMASALAMRLADRHKKDDYLWASGWARQYLSEGKTVLWTAVPDGLVYYKVAPSVDAISQIKGLFTHQDFASTASREVLPDVIIMSPREAIDPGGNTRKILDKGDYVLQGEASAFELYVRRP